MATRRNSQLLQDIPFVLIVAFFCRLACGKVICVDDNAAGANDGSNWENAYVYLQDALADAKSAEKPVEIRAAKGIYRPDRGSSQTRGNREATFQLINGVVLKGGYAGLAAPDPNARDVDLYETILSGDLNGDDLPVNDLHDLRAEATRAENSYNVVVGSRTDDSALLDGFTITAGNANGRSPSEFPSDEWRFVCGAGMYNDAGSGTVANCRFTENSALSGGGMDNTEGNPTVVNCTFTRNYAFGEGGGMQNGRATITLVNCTFSENMAYYWKGGGGMFNWDSTLILTNCKFIGNSANFGGGGILNEVKNTLTLVDCTFLGNAAMTGGGMNGGRATLTNCTFIANEAIQAGGLCSGNSTLSRCSFIANKARDLGGGMWSGRDSLTHCTFSGNSAGIRGGGIYIALYSELILTNCTLIGNSAQYGNALASNLWSREGQGRLSDIGLTNCIVWGSSNEIWNDDGTPIAISYSDIQGGQAGIYDPYSALVWGQGNIDADPMFASPGSWADVNDPNIVVEPNDPNAVWVDGDYHLKSQAGRWDATSESWVMDDVTSPCIDAGDPNSPVGDEPEPNGGRINMGAYGGTPEASKSP